MSKPCGPLCDPLTAPLLLQHIPTMNQLMPTPAGSAVPESQAPVEPKPKRPGNATKSHDSQRVQQFVLAFINGTHLCEAHSAADDILVGAAWLQPEGHKATRPLKRGVLFQVLRACPYITTAAVKEATSVHQYCPAQVARYAASARVASKALESWLDANPQAEAEALDAGCVPAEQEPYWPFD